MSDTVRVFVNGTGIDAPKGGTALDAVAIHSADAARSVRSGAMLVTDSRGIPIPADTAVFNGALFRLIPNRAPDGADPAAQFGS